MKPPVMAATLLIAFSILFSSCDKGHENNGQPFNPLPGHWKADSILIGKDTTLASVFAAMAMHEPAGISFRFTKDSIFTCSQEGCEAVWYRFVAPDRITAGKKLKEQVYCYSRLNDSSALLKTKEGCGFFITKYD